MAPSTKNPLNMLHQVQSIIRKINQSCISDQRWATGSQIFPYLSLKTSMKFSKCHYDIMKTLAAVRQSSSKSYVPVHLEYSSWNSYLFRQNVPTVWKELFK